MTKRMTTEQVQAQVAKEGYPELETFKEPENLKKFYKHLTDAQLDEWLELEGLTFKPTDSPQIARMRKCMSLLYKRFPKQTKPKQESPYKKFSTEELIQMAFDKEVAVDPTDDMRIMRMRTIMALRAAKVVE